MPYSLNTQMCKLLQLTFSAIFLYTCPLDLSYVSYVHITMYVCVFRPQYLRGPEGPPKTSAGDRKRGAIGPPKVLVYIINALTFKYIIGIFKSSVWAQQHPSSSSVSFNFEIYFLIYIIRYPYKVWGISLISKVHLSFVHPSS